MFHNMKVPWVVGVVDRIKCQALKFLEPVRDDRTSNGCKIVLSNQACHLCGDLDNSDIWWKI